MHCFSNLSPIPVALLTASSTREVEKVVRLIGIDDTNNQRCSRLQRAGINARKLQKSAGNPQDLKT
jgi:hypothetical protein